MPKHLKHLFGLALVAPSSSLVASIEGDDLGAGAGGGGDAAAAPAIDPSAAQAAPAPAAPASAAPVEQRFSQADVDRIVADRLARDRAARSERRPNSQAPAQPADGGTPQDLARRLERMETETAFYRGITAAGVALTEDQAADLLELYRVQKPERPGDWIAAKARLFGLKPPAAPSPPAPASPTPPAAPAAPAAAANGAAPHAVDPLSSGGLVDVSRLTKEQIAQLGPQGMREALEKMLASGAGRDGRPALPAALRNLKR